MPFTLTIAAKDAESVVLEDGAVSGTTLVDIATSTFRRTIEGYSLTHIPCGTLRAHQIILPYDIAVQSGKYTNTMSYQIAVSNKFLNAYIFYTGVFRSASLTSNGCTPRQIQFTDTGAFSIYSNIDENAVIAKWASLGFPDYME